MRSVLLIGACALVACAPPSLNSRASEAEVEAFQLTAAQFKERIMAVLENNSDRSSPDRALETRWRIQDELNDPFCEAQRSQEAGYRDWRSALQEFSDERSRLELTGDALAYDLSLRARHHDCLRMVYRREIEEARVETDTRAIVLVRIWNSTPLPEAVQLDGYRREERDGGTRYRYTMSKVGDTWMVGNIDEYNNVLREWRDLSLTEVPVYGFEYSTTVP